MLGEMSLEPKAGDATIAAAGRDGATGLEVVGVSALGVVEGGATGLDAVGDGALGVLGEGVGAAVGVLPIVGSATLIGADGPAAVAGAAALLTPAVTEWLGLERTAVGAAEEPLDVQATALASSPAVMPSSAVRRPQFVIRAVILTVCPMVGVLDRS